jgi:hypothetical protein
MSKKETAIFSFKALAHDVSGGKGKLGKFTAEVISLWVKQRTLVLPNTTS